MKDRVFAIHQLELPDGGLEPLHSHEWRVEAVFRGPILDGLEMLIDFELVSAALRDVLGDLRHSNLNTVPALVDHNPTAEVVAKLIYHRLRDRLGPTAPLAAVYVEEAPGCIAGYMQAGS